MLGRLRQIVGSGSSSGSSAPAASDASPLLGMLAGGREPVLPVTRARPGSSHRRTGSASSVGGQGGRSRKRHLLRIALYLAMAVLLAASIAACTAVAAVAYYTLSIVWESPAAVAAAAAEAQAAVATARAAATRGGQLAQLPANNESTAATGSSQYTVVVMSYKARVSLLILVINQLGNCPSGGAVGVATAAMSIQVAPGQESRQLLHTSRPRALTWHACPATCLSHSGRGVACVEWRRPATAVPLRLPGAGAHPPGAKGERPALLLGPRCLRLSRPGPSLQQRPACHLPWSAHAPPSPAAQNDLSNRMRPDPGISTEAVLLADDDVLMR